MQNRHHHHHIIYKNRKQLYKNYAADFNFAPPINNGFYYPNPINQKILNIRRDISPYVMANKNFANHPRNNYHHSNNRIINNNEHFYVNDDMIGIRLREKMINQHKRNLRRNVKRPIIHNNDCQHSSFKK
jgi:hypothetical protein